MSSVFTSDYRVQKILNNNVLLVTQNNKEKILFENGLGFGKRIGDILSSNSKVDKIFSLEDENNFNNFKQLLSTIDNEIIGLCEICNSSSFYH